MFKQTIMVVMVSAGAAGILSAQTATPKTARPVTHEVTVVADQVYNGTLSMAIEAGKVTGDMHLTAPTEITGKVAGTAQDGQLQLEFPFHMTEQGCNGSVKMKIALPARPGPAKGTMAAVGCGRESDSPLEGTVELKPAGTDGKKPKQD